MQYPKTSALPEPKTPDEIRKRIADLEAFRRQKGNGEHADAIEDYIRKLNERLELCTKAQQSTETKKS